MAESGSALILLPLGLSTGLTRDHIVKASTAIRPLSSCHSASTPWRYGYLAFASAARADDEHGDALVEVTAGGELVDQGAIELRQAFEVELLEGLAGAEGGTAQAHRANFFCSRRATSSSINSARNSV